MNSNAPNEAVYHSIVIEFISGRSPYRINSSQFGAMPHQLAAEGEVSDTVGFTAPWSADADFLVDIENQFIGFTYPIYDEARARYARSLVQAEGGRYLRYIEKDSDYAKLTYASEVNAGCDMVEVRLFDETPASVVHALSIDGGWYVHATEARLFGFVFADLNWVLKEHDLPTDRVLLIPLAD